MIRTKHDGDCSIYSSSDNGKPEDGICTCGYGLDYLRRNGGDKSKLYSEELREKLEKEISSHPPSPEGINLLNKIFGEKIKWVI